MLQKKALNDQSDWKQKKRFMSSKRKKLTDESKINRHILMKYWKLLSNGVQTNYFNPDIQHCCLQFNMSSWETLDHKSQLRQLLGISWTVPAAKRKTTTDNEDANSRWLLLLALVMSFVSVASLSKSNLRHRLDLTSMSEQLVLRRLQDHPRQRRWIGSKCHRWRCCATSRLQSERPVPTWEPSGTHCDTWPWQWQDVVVGTRCPGLKWFTTITTTLWVTAK